MAYSTGVCMLENGISRVVINQSAPGTTLILPGAPKKRTSVVSCVLSPKGGGISTLKFTDGTDDLMGPYRTPGGSASGLIWEGIVSILVHSDFGKPVYLVTTGDAYAGVVMATYLF